MFIIKDKIVILCVFLKSVGFSKKTSIEIRMEYYLMGRGLIKHWSLIYYLLYSNIHQLSDQYNINLLGWVTLFNQLFVVTNYITIFI